ncbi:MAG: hypothetical protein OEN20_11545 [Gammaproteobacteria bacterium]|nr:hypothetical protein [Gammaproteobacteria bacterium]
MIDGPKLAAGLDPLVAGIRRGLREIDAGARELANLNSPARRSSADVAGAMMQLRAGEQMTAASVKALQIESQTLGRLLDIRV